MSRAPLPPEGTSIHVADEPSMLSLSWMPPPSGGSARGFAAAFMLFWLCGWATGEVMVTRALLRESDPWSMSFPLAWLALWTLGGFYALATLWQLLRRPTESSLRLSVETLVYHEGHSPPALRGGGLFGARDQRETWRSLWKKTVRLEIPRAEVRNPKLERIDGDLRLTIDRGADRITIGPRLREPDLEWLHGVLCDWIPDRNLGRDALVR